MPNNFVIVASGRGATYAFMATCELQDLANRCQPALNSGFECYIYSLEASPLGQPGFTPTGALCLRRVYHLYDAHDRYEDEARGIIDGLSAHSEAASREYLDIMIKALEVERQKLSQGAQPTAAQAGS